MYNIPQTNHIQTLIRRAYAGDSKVTYQEFGREIFKNYNDERDYVHYNREKGLEPYNLMRRARSPDIKPIKRFDNKPNDHL